MACRKIPQVVVWDEVITWWWALDTWFERPPDQLRGDWCGVKILLNGLGMTSWTQAGRLEYKSEELPKEVLKNSCAAAAGKAGSFPLSSNADLVNFQRFFQKASSCFKAERFSSCRFLSFNALLWSLIMLRNSPGAFPMFIRAFFFMMARLLTTCLGLW